MADLLNVIVSSEKRRNLLILLSKGPRTWDEIKDLLNVTATGMLPQLKILEDEGLIFRGGKIYSLTGLGKLIVHYLEPFDLTLRVIERQKSFWQTHDISAIPDDLVLRIAELGNVQIIEAGDEEIYESHKQFQEIVLNSSTVRGFAHMVHPIYPDLFLHLAKKGAETELIITRKVFNIVRTKYHRQLSEWLTYPNAKMYVIHDNLKLSFIVTNTYLSLTLFYTNGVYDSKRDLMSPDPSALNWGEDLFSSIRDKSERVYSLD